MDEQKQPHHIEVAQKMAYEIENSFDEIQQNEMVIVIAEIINARRIAKINEARERLSYLESTLPIFQK